MLVSKSFLVDLNNDGKNPFLRGQAAACKSADVWRIRWNVGIVGGGATENWSLPEYVKVQVMFLVQDGIFVWPIQGVLESFEHEKSLKSFAQWGRTALSVAGATAPLWTLVNPAVGVAAGVAPALVSFIPDPERWEVRLFDCRDIYEEGTSELAIGIEWVVRWAKMKEPGTAHLRGFAEVGLQTNTASVATPMVVHFRVGGPWSGSTERFFPATSASACTLDIEPTGGSAE
jgi:hypothetical protein